jgi:hypothetical protein
VGVLRAGRSGETADSVTISGLGGGQRHTKDEGGASAGDERDMVVPRIYIIDLIDNRNYSYNYSLVE